MGTSGTGRFSDYPTSQKGSGGGGSSPDDGGENQCIRAIGDIPLEEVARCEYYVRATEVPAPDTIVRLRHTLYNKRLAIETEAGEIIGLLPTQYNYLLQCMAQGYTYTGHVLTSSLQPIPMVRIDLGPAA